MAALKPGLRAVLFDLDGTLLVKFIVICNNAQVDTFLFQGIHIIANKITVIPIVIKTFEVFLRVEVEICSKPCRTVFENVLFVFHY